MYEAQYSLIGALLVYPQLFDCCILTKEHFIQGLNIIFSEMQKMYAEEHTITYERLFAIKGVDADLIVACQDRGGMYSAVDSFNRLQKLIIEVYKKNQIAAMSTDLISGGIDLDIFDANYRNLLNQKIAEPEYLDTQTLLRSCTEKKQLVIFKRFKKLSDKLVLHQGDFIVLAGKTGVGKTGVAINLLDDLSRTYECMYFNMEMAQESMHQRLVAINSQVPIKDLSDYKVLPDDLKNNMNKAINAIAQRKIEVVNGSQSIEQIRNNIASRNHDHHMIIFVDHIGLIKYSKAKSTYDRVTEIAKELRRICLDYNCTVIGLSQLNRIRPEDTRPRLSMLRDSGELEQSARKVIFIWETESDGYKKYELVIEKNDSNDKGIVDIDYYKQTQIIREQ